MSRIVYKGVWDQDSVTIKFSTFDNITISNVKSQVDKASEIPMWDKGEKLPSEIYVIYLCYPIIKTSN